MNHQNASAQLVYMVARACVIDVEEGSEWHQYAYSVRSRVKREFGAETSPRQIRRAIHTLERCRLVEAVVSRSRFGWGHPRYRATIQLVQMLGGRHGWRSALAARTASGRRGAWSPLK